MKRCQSYVDDLAAEGRDAYLKSSTSLHPLFACSCLFLSPSVLGSAALGAVWRCVCLECESVARLGLWFSIGIQRQVYANGGTQLSACGINERSDMQKNTHLTLTHTRVSSRGISKRSPSPSTFIPQCAAKTICKLKKKEENRLF